jgi:hypothetical protein
MRTISLLVAFAFISCTPEPGGQLDGNYPAEQKAFCDLDHVVPVLNQACVKVIGDFNTASDVADVCVVSGKRYSCLTTQDTLYYNGIYENDEMVASVSGCSLCNGSTETVIAVGPDILFEMVE